MNTILPGKMKYFLLVVISLLASVFIILHGQWHLLKKAFTSASFYSTLAVSFTITMLLLIYIHKMMNWLNVKYSWQEKALIHIWMQILVGIIAPALMDLAIIAIYLNIMGTGIIESGFLSLDFPVIVLFIIVINAIYIIVDFINLRVKPLIIEEYEKKQADKLIIDYNRVHVELSITKEVLCFQRSGRNVTVITIHGREFVTNVPLNQLEEKCKSQLFHRINPSVIINGRFIKGYRTGVKRDTMQIILFAEQLNNLTDPQNKLFVITKKYLKDFKTAFEAK